MQNRDRECWCYGSSWWWRTNKQKIFGPEPAITNNEEYMEAPEAAATDIENMHIGNIIKPR